MSPVGREQLMEWMAADLAADMQRLEMSARACGAFDWANLAREAIVALEARNFAQWRALDGLAVREALAWEDGGES